MKRLTKLTACLLILFLVFPFFESIVLNNSVEAGRYVTTTTSRSEEIRTKMNANEQAELVETQYSYSVYYQRTFNLDIYEDDLNLFKVGNSFNCNDMNVTVVKLVKISSEKRFKDVKIVPIYKNCWSCAVTIGGYYKTGWSTQRKTLNNFSPIQSTYSSQYYRLTKDLTPQRISESTRYVWHITDKQKSLPNTGTTINSGTKTTTSGQQAATIAQNTYYSTYNNTSASPIVAEPVVQVPVVTEKAINLNTAGKALYIRGLYRRVLGREPTISEINHHANSGLSCQKIACNIIFSDASKSINKIDSMSNEQFVKALYKYILNREGDSGGIKTHTDWLNKGNSRDDLVICFENSDEFSKIVARENKTISFANDVTCTACRDYLINNGYSVVKTDDKKIYMYADEVSKVKSLDISGKGLTDVTGISAFPNLINLNVSNNKIENLNEICKFSKLNKLQLNNNGVKVSLTNLGKLTSLTILELRNCGLSNADLAEVGKLSNLQQLYLNNNALTAFVYLSNLPKLTTLQLDNNYISEISNIESSQLKTCTLKNNKITVNAVTNTVDIPAVIQNAKTSGNILYTQSDLELNGCTIKNNKIVLNGSTASVTVKGGNADGSSVIINNNTKDIEIMDKVLADRLEAKLGNKIISRTEKGGRYYLKIDKNDLASVKSLDLSATVEDPNKIQYFTGLEQFTNLTTLNLSNNSAMNLFILNTLTNLTTLNISNNCLANLDSVNNIYSLKSLDASNNTLYNIEGVSKLTKLDTLLVGNNNIESLNGIENLDLQVLDISNNKVSDISAMKNTIETINLYNNNGTIKTEGNSIDIPAIVTYSGGIDKTKLTNCSVKNNKIVLDNGKTIGTIQILDGKSKGTIITIESTGDKTPPTLSVSYSYDKTNSSYADVTIKSNEPIIDIWRTGWKISEDKKSITRRYTYNANEVIPVSDIYGNEANASIVVDKVQNNAIPGLAISYSNYQSKTNRKVKIIVNADVPLAISRLSAYGWEYSDETHKSIYCETDKNITWVPTIQTQASEDAANEQNEIIRNNGGKLPDVGTTARKRYDELTPIYNQKLSVNFNVENIDTEGPECQVSYVVNSNGSVTVTIKSNEALSCPISTFPGWTVNDDKTEIYKTFNANQAVEQTVYDEALNSTTINFTISDIDNIIDGLSTKSNATFSTKDSVKVQVQANEKITVKEDALNVASNNVINTVTAAINKLNNTRVVASTGIMPIMDGTIDSLQTEPIFFAKDAVPLAIVAEEKQPKSDDNKIELEFDENVRGVVPVEDEAGNMGLALVDVSNIDNDIPVIGRSEDIINEDGSVTVTLVLSEPIAQKAGLLDWKYDEQNLTLTKTFNANKTEKLTIEDLVGNTIEYEVVVNSVNTINYDIYYNYEDGEDVVTVVIESNTELKEIDGWSISEDKKAIAKVVRLGEKGEVTIEDYNGNTTLVKYDANVVGEQSNENSDEQQSEVDNTQADKIIPQTGNFFLGTYILCVALIAITTAVLIVENKRN